MHDMIFLLFNLDMNNKWNNKFVIRICIFFFKRHVRILKKFFHQLPKKRKRKCYKKRKKKKKKKNSIHTFIVTKRLR